MDVAERLPNNDLSWIPGAHSRRKNQLVQVVVLLHVSHTLIRKAFGLIPIKLRIEKLFFKLLLLMFILILCV